MTDPNHLNWKHAKEIRGLDRVIEAQKTGYLDEDAPHDHYIEIPEEPDRKWTDKPSRQAAG